MSLRGLSTDLQKASSKDVLLNFEYLTKSEFGLLVKAKEIALGNTFTPQALLNYEQSQKSDEAEETQMDAEQNNAKSQNKSVAKESRLVKDAKSIMFSKELYEKTKYYHTVYFKNGSFTDSSSVDSAPSCTIYSHDYGTAYGKEWIIDSVKVSDYTHNSAVIETYTRYTFVFKDNDIYLEFNCEGIKAELTDFTVSDMQKITGNYITLYF